MDKLVKLKGSNCYFAICCQNVFVLSSMIIGEYIYFESKFYIVMERTVILLFIYLLCVYLLNFKFYICSLCNLYIHVFDLQFPLVLI